MNTPQLPPSIVETALDLRQPTELLVEHYGLQEGLYDLLIEFQIGTGVVNSGEGSTYPGASIGLSKLGLMRVTTLGANTIDAEKLANSKKSSVKKKKKI